MVRVALLALLLLAGCPDEKDHPDPLTSQLSNVRVQLRQLEIIARQYDLSMIEATDATCISVHRTYDLQARMFVMNLGMLAEDLDDTIIEHAGAGYADVTCTVAEVERERSYHGALACQEDALADDLAEASRHLIALGDVLEHLTARAAEIGAGQATETDPPPGPDPWIWSLPSFCP